MEIWLTVLDRFGLPLFLVLGLGYFTAKRLWPFLQKHLEHQQQALDANIERTQEVLRAQLEHAQRVRDEEMKLFIAALAQRDAALAKVVEELGHLARTIDRWSDAQRQRREGD